MRIRAALASLAIALAAVSACGKDSGLFRQYEYEEDIYLALDGSATVYVNSSLPALNALRGSAFDTRPNARLDREAVREYFSTPVSHVRTMSASRRSGRQFVHLRIEVDDIRQLGTASPFSWSTYRFDREDDVYAYEQTVGLPAGKDVAGVGWTGNEQVAFRLHLPSKITYHNTTDHTVGRGNILTWEQPLADRLRGEPLKLEARMETQSILYRTLLLFGLTFVAVAIMFAAVIWWVLRRSPKPVEV